MREQDRRNALALPRVRDQKCDLCGSSVRPGPDSIGIAVHRRVLDPDVCSVGDDAFRCPGLGDQRKPIRVIDVDRPVGYPVEVDRPEEPKSDRLARTRRPGTPGSQSCPRAVPAAHERSTRRAGAISASRSRGYAAALDGAHRFTMTSGRRLRPVRARAHAGRRQLARARPPRCRVARWEPGGRRFSPSSRRRATPDVRDAGRSLGPRPAAGRAATSQHVRHGCRPTAGSFGIAAGGRSISGSMSRARDGCGCGRLQPLGMESR